VAKILHENNLIGFLIAIDRTEPRDFSEDEQLFVKGLADHTALAFTNAYLYETSRRHADQLLAVNTLGRALSETRGVKEIYARATGTILQIIPNISTIFISSYNPLTQKINYVYGYQDDEPVDVEIFPPVNLESPGVGTQSQAIHTRRPVIINGLRKHLKKVKKKVNIGTPGRETQSGVFVPMLAREQVTGVIQIQSYTLNRFSAEDGDLLGLIANTTAIALENARLLVETNKRLEQMGALRQIEKSISANQELNIAYEAIIEGWSHALDLRDKEAKNHTRRVMTMTGQLAREMGLDEAELIRIWRGALLHDIGKMGVPDDILLKPGGLSEDEWKIMRKHPGYAYNFLSEIQYLIPASDIPYCHHEKWDGSGYPRGLKGEEIPLAARIFAVIDVWDALTSDRPYRLAWSTEKTLEYIGSSSGTHFDPGVVEAFLRLVNQLK
jgi:HD-GYP domain-containing protein (c-di-GMP phosphodiesterase class II)